jgi:hypothetical protein
MHVSGLHLRIRIGRLAGALALAAGTLTLASVALGVAGSTPAGAATGCGMSVGPIQLEGAAGSLVFDAQAIPAVPGQGCNATVSLTGTIETPGGTLANNVAGNGQAHTLTVSFLPGQPPPDIIWEWSPHCADPGNLPYQFFVSSPTAGTATSPPLNPSGSPSLSCSLVGTIPGSTLNPPEVEIENPESYVAMAPTPGGLGYWLVTRVGDSKSFGNAAAITGPSSNAPVVGAADASAGGYWQAASDGGVFALGTAPVFGSMGGHPLNAPVVGIASTPDHGGYWLVATDGGVFSFGDAPFFGSMGGHPLNAPVVGIASGPAGKGYWLVAADGGVFAFGEDVPFFGSMGGKPLNKPVVGMVGNTIGAYWLVASDGGVFSFGAAFEGSLGSLTLNAPITGVAATDPGGYWMVGGDGGVFAFGDAPFRGSAV